MLKKDLKNIIGIVAVIATISMTGFTAKALGAGADYSRVSQSTINQVVKNASSDLDDQSKINVSLPEFPSYSEMVVLDVTKYPFYADKTGKTDATDDLQRALNAAKEGASDDVLYKLVFPKGTYLTTEALRIYSNTWVYLEEESQLKSMNGTNGLMSGGVSTDEQKNTDYNGIRNVILEGGIWDGNGGNIYDGVMFSRSLIRFGHGQNILINEVTVKNDINGHHMEFCGVKNLAVTNCNLSGYYGTSKKEAIQIDMTHDAKSAPAFESFDDTHSQNVIIYGCKFKDLQRGVGTHSAILGEYFNDILIAKNTFEDVKLQAVYALNYKHCIVYDNVMKNVGSGVMLKYWVSGSSFYYPLSGRVKELEADTDTIIRKNRITVKMNKNITTGYGIQCSGGTYTGTKFPQKEYNMDNLTICDNTINMAYDAGIQLSSVYNSSVFDNRIIDVKKNSTNGGSSANGIYVKNSFGCQIGGNIIEKSSKNGIYLLNSAKAIVSGQENQIEQNVIENCLGSVVMLSNSTASIFDNTITGTGDNTYGIYLQGSTAKIESNKISNNGFQGITVMGASTASILNNVFENQWDGIDISPDCDVNVPNFSMDPVGTVFNTDLEIKGTTINGNLVNLYCEGKQIASGDIMDNAYLVSIPNQKSGKAIIIKAEDSSGNIMVGQTKVITNFSSPILGTAEAKAYNKIKFSWAKDELADGYYVYRKTANESWKKIDTITDGTISNYTDEKVKTGEIYYYTVKAFDFTNESDCDRIGICAVTALDKMETLTVVSEKKKETVFSWNRLDGATGYRILVKDKKGEWVKYKTFQDGEKVSYTAKELKSKSDYTFTIRAFRKEGTKTIWSDYNLDGVSVIVK